MVESPRRPRNVDREHPWLTELESAVIKSLGRQATWFYVPAVAVAQS